MIGYVYFVQAFDGGPIKIGFSQKPKTRLSALQSGQAAPLDLVATIRAPKEFERVLHNELAPWRLQGEWFEDSRFVCQIVEGFIRPKPGSVHEELIDFLGVLTAARAPLVEAA